MRKYRIKNSRRFICSVLCLMLISVFAGGAALGLFNAESKIPGSYTEVEICEGDTIWNIAKVFGPANKDIRENVYNICKINDISAETLRAGQVILVPIN